MHACFNCEKLKVLFDKIRVLENIIIEDKEKLRRLEQSNDELLSENQRLERRL